MGRISFRLFLAVTALVLCGAMLAACTAPSHVSTPTIMSVTPTVTTVATKEPLQPTPTIFIKTFDPWVSITVPASALSPAVNPPEYQVLGEGIEADVEVLSQLSDDQVFRAYKWISGQEGDPVYFADQADYHQKMADFLRLHPELTVKQQQSPDKASILTYIVKKNGDVSSVLFGFKDGVLAFAEPNVADSETKLGEVVIPDGLNPEFVYNPADGHWYLFAVDKDNNANYWLNTNGATIDNLESQWERIYDTTEFTGNFTNENMPTFKDSFVYHHEQTGIDIPIDIGLTNDMADKELILSNEGKEVYIEFLIAAYCKTYNQQNGTSLNADEYMTLVSQGKGDVEYRYIDAITGEKKVSLVSIRNGRSDTLTGNSELPLTRTPSNAKYPSHFNLTLNKQGKIIVVAEVNQQYMQDNADSCIESGDGSRGYCRSFTLFIKLLTSIKYSLLLDKDAFYSGGLMMDLNHPDLDSSVIEAFKEAALHEDPLNDSYTQFAEAK